MLCRVIDDCHPRSGAWNMAMDATLLSEVVAGGDTCFLRLYRWQSPTVTLGYFQSNDDDQIAPELQECERVRRLSGGGAILHDQEITYSCCLPVGHEYQSDPVRLYAGMHNAIIECLSAAGAPNASLRQDCPPLAADSDNPETFLCFLRHDDRDIVYNGHKIVGSAQRRRRGAILQHGSILLRSSYLTPEIKGICDIAPGFNKSSFQCALAAHLVPVISKTHKMVEYTDHQLQMALTIMNENVTTDT